MENMDKFYENIEKICEYNEKVAMFIDMDGTIIVYEVYPEHLVKERMERKYSDGEPLTYIIDKLNKISKIKNIDLYILSLSKSEKITKEKEEWLRKYLPFIDEKNWIILTKEFGEYTKENRDIIKALKIKEKENEYNHLILLDDDHKILKETQSMLGEKASVFHISSAII